MKQHRSARFCGSGVIAGTLLAIVSIAVLHLLRPGYNPLRNFMSEYLIGLRFPWNALSYVLAATFLMLLVGLRLSVRPSGSLAASCVLMGVIVVMACMGPSFPLDELPPDGSSLPATFSRSAIVHLVLSALFYAAVVAILFTLPGAYRRDDAWQPFSRVTLFLAYLTVASFVVMILAPFYLRGLAQRGNFLVILVWLLLTGLRLRRALPETFVKAALLFIMVVTLGIFGAAGVFRILLSFFTPPRTDIPLYWSLVVLCFAMGTFSFWRSSVELLAYLRERKMESSLRPKPERKAPR
jgi:hypothetical protein